MEQPTMLYHLQRQDQRLSSQVAILALHRSLVDSSKDRHQCSTLDDSRDHLLCNIMDNYRDRHLRSSLDNNKDRRLVREEQLHTCSQIAMLDRIPHLLLLVWLHHTVHREHQENTVRLNREGMLRNSSSNNHRLLRRRSSVSIRLRYHDQ